jgi:hypothetical protein
MMETPFSFTLTFGKVFSLPDAQRERLRAFWGLQARGGNDRSKSNVAEVVQSRDQSRGPFAWSDFFHFLGDGAQIVPGRDNGEEKN